MIDKLTQYRRADAPLPTTNRLWPLYGAGFENFGVDGKPITIPMPTYGPDELLIRHDACGHCFSDIKVIHAGQNHPRIHRNMRERPVVLGHEVSITVVGVGEALRDQYKVGDRFIVQADIFYHGQNYSYGYEIDGGLSEYTVIDQRVLNGDYGNYLIPIRNPETGYAEAALTEPWACVIAAYQLRYRTAPRADGTMWIIGTARAKPLYTFSQGFDETAHPAKLLLTNVPAAFDSWLRTRAASLGIEVVNVPELPDPATVETDDAPVSPAGITGGSGKGVDDIILLGADPDLIERISPNLAGYGIMALLDDTPMPRPIKVDVGRIHYNRWLYVGSTGTNIAAAYSNTPARSTLKPGGRAWFVGAGGPMGRMHVQAAIEAENGPAVIVCTDVSDVRLDDLCTSFSLEAQNKGIEFICLNPMNKEAYAAVMAPFKATGFDDIIVLAPVTPVIADAATHLAPKGVMNIFAGVPRGKFAEIDLSDVYLRQTRIIGHSASTIENMRFMLEQAETGQLSPNRSVAAIGSLEAAYDGLKAVDETRFPGKIVIYPHIKPLPLTALTDLKDVLPTVYAKLKDGREWTNEAEAELLRVMLP
ncbi:MAG TPA: alcohol dehydrogenase catalytic domain-containing protein [Anaerolineae bacterium]|nr:alcohol dehydrogenase catalytic domain-containing protein [Anaerolineae bacterium]HQK13881.1 alcohol dehydrogenase catalytic domain-containing protein [Anaerolineae bacterium]